MSSTKPHVVLIPGAWHTSAAWELVEPLLKVSGYQVTSLTLPSVGAEPPITSLQPDVDFIRSAVDSILATGQDVLVVMHSYGGVAGASSLRGLSKQDRVNSGQSSCVSALVYICAWMIPEGQTLRQAGGGRGGKAGPKRLREEGDYLHHLEPIPAFYHDVESSLADRHVSGLKHHSVRTFHSPSLYAAHKNIPTTYLLCKEDQTIPYERQVALVNDAGVPITLYTCDASHSPMLSQPELVARIIRRAAGENIAVAQS